MTYVEYEASLDTTAKLITLGAIVLFIAIGQKSFRVIWFEGGHMATISLHSALLLFFISVTVGCYLYAPQFYSLDDTLVTIHRLANNVTIKLSDIAKVREVANEEMAGSTRTFAVGGFFGYFGKFYVPQFGSVTLFATQRKNRVLILTKQGEKIIITPDDTGIVKQIQARLLQKIKS